MKLRQITKREFTKQPNKNLPNNQIGTEENLCDRRYGGMESESTLQDCNTNF